MEKGEISITSLFVSTSVFSILLERFSSDLKKIVGEKTKTIVRMVNADQLV